MDAGSNNWNERKRNKQHGMDGRDEWRRKIKVQAQKDVKTSVLCTIYIIHWYIISWHLEQQKASIALDSG